MTGAGMLVSVADQDFSDSFGESNALAKYLASQRTIGATELMRELGATHGAKAPEEVEPYRGLVLGAASAVAEAKGGVKPAEEGALAAIREALGVA